MKQMICLFLSVLFFHVAATAEGFFPSADALFGQTMPSIGSVVNRNADEETELDEGKLCTYKCFTEKDYTDFGSYLGGIGCTLDNINVEEDVLTAVINLNGFRTVFTYDYGQKTASMLYPEGTRKENMKQEVKDAVSLFPVIEKAFGTALPSMNPILGRTTKTEKMEDGSIRHTYFDVRESEYDAFSRYLSAYGCKLVDNASKMGIIHANLECDGTTFSFEYDSNSHKASVIYPRLSWVEDREYKDDPSLDSLLPLADAALGALMPRIALSVDLKSGGIIEHEDGSYEETYQGFTDEEYVAFSKYLKESGCEVSDYAMDDYGVLTINLKKGEVPFTVTYDRAGKQATVLYAAGSRLEPTPTPKPTATPAPIPTAATVPKPTKKLFYAYSETDCWSTAETYFMNLSWKNPSSLTIHGHTSSLSDGEYFFIIDYSAQNGFGGFNRSSGYVSVDASTNRVTMSYVPD